MSRLCAVILAAGLSSRMGRFKPLLPLGGGTVLSRCVDLFKANDIGEILVVTGNRAQDVARAASVLGAWPVFNPDYEEGMFSSVLTGVRALPRDCDGFLLLPVDIPLVRPATVARLMGEFARATPAVLFPRYRGERGHPPVINGSLIPDILSHDGRGGLRTVLEGVGDRAMDLDVADFGTVHDLDHPGDYDLALELVDHGPDPGECEQLWDMYGVDREVRDHCRAVAVVAQAMTAALNGQRGADEKIDASLVRGAALIHDLAKGEPDHGPLGGGRLMEHGFDAAADIVTHHSDLEPENGPFTERELVFLADKLVRGDRFCSLDRRYGNKLDLFGDKPGARENILARQARARAVSARFETEAGVSAARLAREVLA